MMKLVISFDELNITENTSIGDAIDNIYDFLQNQFPEWDYSEVFDVENMVIDFDNEECHIDMTVIE